jgi:chemotaxis family two-component system response regulator Rcp1
MVAMSKTARYTLFLVEDNPGDVLLIQEAFRREKLDVNIVLKGDGERALQLLTSLAESGEPLPDIILLDINLPRKDGFETLTDLKSDHRLKDIPTIIFSASENPADIARAYALGANCYILKPYDPKDFFYVINSVIHFWGNLKK